MKKRLQISTRKLSLSDIAIDNIKSKAQKLEKFYDRIIACKVMVDRPHRHKNHGMEYNVSIDIAVPGAEIVVKHEHNQDVYVAIRNAFESAQRQLKNLNKRQKGKKPKVLVLPAMQSAEVEADRLMDFESKLWPMEFGV